jgi:AraC family of transcriptional regulator, multidrug resistance transcriptional activator
MKRDQEIVHSVRDWIDGHLRQPLSVSDVSRKAGYSKWHFQRMFSRIMNISLGVYIRNKKLESAARDLAYTDMSIIDISFRYGYESQQAFTRSFIHKYRSGPNEYRRIHNFSFEGRLGICHKI